jgi:hypothetical protein
VATERWEILDANMLPPTTATEVQIVCPIVAPAATPSAFLCVASCTRKLKIMNKSTKKQIQSKNKIKIHRQILSTEVIKDIGKAEI